MEITIMLKQNITSWQIHAALAYSLLLTAFIGLSVTGCESNNISSEVASEVILSTTETDVLIKKGSPTGIMTIASFDASLIPPELPESIAVDHFGNIYVSMSPLRQIWKLNPEGAFEKIVTSFSLEPGLFGVSGLRFDPRGNLYIAISSTNTDMNGLWKITPSGEKERIAGTGDILLPNDVAISPNGSLYITDSAMGSVWRYFPGGHAEIWVQDEALAGTGAFGLGVPIGANGIVVTPDKKKLSSDQNSIGGVTVANSEKGQLVYVPILPGGSAGEPIVKMANPAVLFGLDGITVDAHGTIFGAVNFSNTIVRISSDGSNLSEIAAGAPLDFPTSLVFGTGNAKHTLFIVNFGVIHFLSNTPMPNDASPAVLSMRIDP